MSGIPHRAVIHLMNPWTESMPERIQAAVLLNQIVQMWFDGKQYEAAEAMGVAKQTFSDYARGKVPVSRPMLKRMADIIGQAEELERRRQQRERAGQTERRSMIPLLRNRIAKLRGAKENDPPERVA